MENLISRYRNVTILVAILFVQVLGLAVQVKRSSDDQPTRLIRVWAVEAVTPFEKAIVWAQSGVSNIWHNYFYLRGVRQENRELKKEIESLQIAQVRLNEDAQQARRLQTLLGFREQFILQTIAAQVIGSSGSEQSRSVYIDKGWSDGVKPDMAVITAAGVVGKVLRVFNKTTSLVLLVNDQTSGVGAILEKSRLQGVLRGTPLGEVVLEKVMSDETVQPGERVLTSGGDRIFPKGLPVGTVTQVSPGAELFLNIRVKPAADLGRLEEVLVITQQVEREPAVSDGSSMRAADILAQRLPSVPDRPPDDPNKPPPPTSGLTILPVPNAVPEAGGTIAKPSKPAVVPEHPSATTAGAKQHLETVGSRVKASSNSTGPVTRTSTAGTKPVAVQPAPAGLSPAKSTPAEPVPAESAPQEQPQ